MGASEARARADAAYEAGDWSRAAEEFLAVAAEGGENVAAAYHRAGTALLKARRFDEAVLAYERALEDVSWQRASETRTNLGAAYAALERFEDAAAVYATAAEDLANPVRHRALSGLGAALERFGRYEEAANAYRQAVLVEQNPDPGKALNNLGLSYMALGRPADAADAYRAALELDSYRSKGKTAANLGRALHEVGDHAGAVAAFDRAVVEYGHELSRQASVAYKASLAAVEQAEEAERIAVLPGWMGSGSVVEGWSTGEMPVLSPTPVTYEIDDEIETPFFTRTDDEMRALDREARRAERAEGRSAHSAWVTALTWLAVIAVIAGLVGYAWMSGLGYPTQSMTVKGLLDAHHEGRPVDDYWVAVPTTDVTKEMSSLPPTFTDYVIGEVDAGARTATVAVTVTLEQGAPLSYSVSLVREGVGWKVKGVTNDWRSTGGGS